jgi:hypothetical protein
MNNYNMLVDFSEDMLSEAEIFIKPPFNLNMARISVEVSSHLLEGDLGTPLSETGPNRSFVGDPNAPSRITYLDWVHSLDSL